MLISYTEPASLDGEAGLLGLLKLLTGVIMKQIFKLGILSIALANLPAFSATPINLLHKPIPTLTTFFSLHSPIKLEEVSRNLDFNKTMHIRMKETYRGYTVFGGDAIMHIPNAKELPKSLNAVAGIASTSNAFMNGTIYQDLAIDLDQAPASIYTQEQAQKALQIAINAYQDKIGAKPVLKNQHSQLIVYVDANNKAHWAYQVSFYANPVNENAMPAKPVYIMDAITFQVYKQWNDIKTGITNTFGGGYGGNKKMGKLVYDGLMGDLDKLDVIRDSIKFTCYMQNKEVVVRDNRNKNKISSYTCISKDSTHNKVYWNNTFDSAHGGYSPANDALYAGAVIKDMYQNWYNQPVLKNADGSPMLLTMLVHLKIDNAFWDGEKMSFGDGVSYFYPLTSLGVAAHEVSHGFTEQHSNLNYDGQSGGMNESYSDMAAMAAEYYSNGESSWQIGGEILIDSGSLRYMDQPSRDCNGGTPGDYCSIDNANQYYDGLDVHFSSGVYNRLFYLLGTATDWNTRKAFDVMVQANMNYWTPETTFASGACGVIQATKDLGYDLNTVNQAFSTVGIDTSKC